MWPDELPDSQAHALSGGSGHKQIPLGPGRRVGQELVSQTPLKAGGHHWHPGKVFPPLYTAAVAAMREKKQESKSIQNGQNKWYLYFTPINLLGSSGMETRERSGGK